MIDYEKLANSVKDDLIKTLEIGLVFHQFK